MNISAMHVGRSAPRADALMILALDDDVPPAVAEAIRTHDSVDRPVDDPARERTLSRGRRRRPRSPTASTRRSSSSGTANRRSSSSAASRARPSRRCPPTGRRQAALVGRAARRARTLRPPCRSRPAPPLAIVHSPLGRADRDRAIAIATAAADPAGTAVARSARIRGFARDRPGRVGGPARDEIAARYGERLAAWRRTPLTAWAPGGESLADVRARVRPAPGRRSSRGSPTAGRPGTIDRPRSPATATPSPTIRGRSSSATTASSRSRC